MVGGTDGYPLALNKRLSVIWLRARNVACNTLVLQQLTSELDFATISLLWSLRKRLVR